VRALKLFVATVVGLGGLAGAAAPAQAGKGADPDAVRTLTSGVQVVMQVKHTPIEGGFSNYCAVGAFVPFNDIAGGYEVDSVTVTYFDKPTTESVGQPPYSDGASINGLVFPPAGAAHHHQLGDFSYGQGGGDPAVADQSCREMRERVDSFFGASATVTYVHTDKCKSALGAVEKAAKAVKSAQKKVNSTTGEAHTAALAKLAQTQKKLAKAKKKAKKACR
jgi:hypothetical protein